MFKGVRGGGRAEEEQPNHGDCNIALSFVPASSSSSSAMDVQWMVTRDRQELLRYPTHTHTLYSRFVL